MCEGCIGKFVTVQKQLLLINIIKNQIYLQDTNSIILLKYFSKVIVLVPHYAKSNICRIQKVLFYWRKKVWKSSSDITIKFDNAKKVMTINQREASAYEVTVAYFSILFSKMGKSRPLFVYFHYFHFPIQNGKYILGTI